MGELGERLKEIRKKIGVTLEESSTDLNIPLIELENIEKGNYRIFKDVYDLKDKVKSYAKYLGLDADSISDEFNNFVFEKTSKISLSDIKSVRDNEKNKEKEKISSPYTRIKPTKYDFAPIVLIVVLLMFISLIVYLLLIFFRNDNRIDRELKNKMEVVYEFTK